MNVEVTNFEYEPGGKWDCGTLWFDAQTPLDLFTWREVVPGPRHCEDDAELEFKLNGNEMSEYEPDATACYRDFSFPNFEPPNKPGRDADNFNKNGTDLITEVFSAWLEKYEKHPELARVLALPPREEDEEDDD